ncbi:MAG: FAD-binding oxidoreductase [Casimicrobiaceae bacterium]
MSLGQPLREWRAAIGDDAVRDAEAATLAYGSSTTGEHRRIAAALRPASREQVPRIVEIAVRSRVPLYPISTGHNWGYGCALPARDDCVVLDLSRLDAISDFDPDIGTLTVEPGVTQQMLAQFLEARHAPFLVPVTGAGPSASILGNALERGYGITPHADHFLAVQSLEAVLADGRVYRPALAALGAEAADRAFKWGVGPYLDGLFAQGSFGIVTAMTIALARRPDRVRAFLFALRGEDALGPCVAALRDVLSRLPGLVGGINLMNRRRVLAMAAPFPANKVSADGLLADSDLAPMAARLRVAPWTAFGTLYGTAKTVRAAQSEIRRLVRPVAQGLTFISPTGARRMRRVAQRLPGKAGAALARRAALLDSSLDLVAGRPSQGVLPLAYWRSGRLPPAGEPMDPARDGCGLIWYAPLVPMTGESVLRYVTFVTATMRRHQIEPLLTLTTLSERCFDSSVPLLFDRNDPAAVARATACYRALLDEGAREGFVPYRVAGSAMDWLVRPGIVAWDVAAAIKRAFDPLDIIAPGRYAPRVAKP